MQRLLVHCTVLLACTYLAQAEWGFELENNGIHFNYGHGPVPVKGTVIFPATAHPTTLDQLFSGTPWPWKNDWVLTVDEQVGTNHRDLEIVSRALPLKAKDEKRVCKAIHSMKTVALAPLNAARVAPKTPPAPFTATLTQGTHNRVLQLDAVVVGSDAWSPQVTMSLPIGTAAPGSPSAFWQFLKGIALSADAPLVFANQVWLHFKRLIMALDGAGFRISDAEKAFVAVIASYWYSGACITKARLTYFGKFPGYPKGIASFILMRTSLAAIYQHLGPNKKTPQELAQIVIDLGHMILDNDTPATQGVAGGCRKGKCGPAADPTAKDGLVHNPKRVFFSVCSDATGAWVASPDANLAPTLEEFFNQLGHNHDILSNTGYNAVHNPVPHTDSFESMGKLQALDGSHHDMVRFELRAFRAGASYGNAHQQDELIDRIWMVYKAGQSALDSKGRSAVKIVRATLPTAC